MTDHFLLPQVEDILYDLAGFLFYSTFDLTSGYWLILADERDRWKTAFVLQVWSLRMGRNALWPPPSFFQRLTYQLARAIDPARVKAYLDDITIEVNTEDEAPEIWLRLQLQAPPREMHPLSAEDQSARSRFSSSWNFALWKRSLQGFRKHRGPSPRMTCAFLGLVGYYQKFIPHYSE
jgi:hypothetical protein